MKILSSLFVSFLTITSRSRINCSQNLQSSMIATAATSDSSIMEQVKSIVPKLTNDRHKGQAGRIGIVLGSKEYTGAAYYSAISALKVCEKVSRRFRSQRFQVTNNAVCFWSNKLERDRRCVLSTFAKRIRRRHMVPELLSYLQLSLQVGADLVHVFCAQSAAPVIKGYSPDLIVHPLLDVDNGIDEIEPWLDRLHVVLIGPGLGRDGNILATVTELIKLCRRLKKQLVIDADGLFLISQDLSLIKDYAGVILTPNAAEFTRLFGENFEEKMKELGGDITVIEKMAKDRIYNTTNIGVAPYECPPGGSGRRCGGQGDLMGSIATFYHWSLDKKHPNAAFIASYAGSFLTKKCNEYAFALKGRSMLTTDMIEQIHNVFEDFFENKE